MQQDVVVVEEKREVAMEAKEEEEEDQVKVVTEEDKTKKDLTAYVPYEEYLKLSAEEKDKRYKAKQATKQTKQCQANSSQSINQSSPTVNVYNCHCYSYARYCHHPK